MKCNTEQKKDKAETYNYYPDLMILSNVEKMVIYNTVKTLLSVQKENDAVFADVPVSIQSTS